MFEWIRFSYHSYSNPWITYSERNNFGYKLITAHHSTPSGIGVMTLKLSYMAVPFGASALTKPRIVSFHVMAWSMLVIYLL